MKNFYEKNSLKNPLYSEIDFGMPTLIELNSIKENVELCKELNLNFIELNMNMPYCTILGYNENDTSVKVELNDFISELNEYQKKYGIYFTIHLDENFNFADMNNYVRNAYLKTLENVVHNSCKIKCPVINMHLNPGIYFTLPTEKVFLFEKYNEYYEFCVDEFINFSKNEMKNLDFKPLLSIENTNGWKSFEKISLDKILKYDNFALTFDIGHSEAIGNLDEQFILEHKSKLKHFHIHDGTLPNSVTKSFGKNHLELGTGSIDLLGRLNLAKETNSRCVIETKTVEALKNSVSWLNKNFS